MENDSTASVGMRIERDHLNDQKLLLVHNKASA